MKRQRTKRSGFTLLELASATTLVGLVSLGFVELYAQGQRMVRIADDEHELLVDLADALRDMQVDLERSGFVDLGAERFPQLRSSQDDKTQTMQADWPERLSPESTEFEIVMPDDSNNDGWPDLDADRQLIWSPTRITYTFADDGTGRAALVRSVEGGQQRVLLTGVVNAVFEDPAATGWTLPLQHVRVTLTAERIGALGFVSQRTATRVFRLPNGGLAN